MLPSPHELTPLTTSSFCLQALDGLRDLRSSDPQLLEACQGGLARCSLQCGDLRGGRALALQLGSAPLLRECAGALGLCTW